MERFVVIVNGWKPLTIITKWSILDVAAVLDPPLIYYHNIDESQIYDYDSHITKTGLSQSPKICFYKFGFIDGIFELENST